MRIWVYLAVFGLCFSAAGVGRAQQATLVAQKSAHDAATTVARLEAAIKQRGATIVAKVDHAAAAKANGLELRPTVVLVFGNPKLGTPLMQSNQAAGLDLPLRIVAWQDAAGVVMVGYWPPDALAAAHGIKDRDAVVKTMTGALAGIVAEAVKP